MTTYHHGFKNLVDDHEDVKKLKMKEHIKKKEE